MIGDLDVLVLAAGKSTRIASVAKDLPKPLIPIMGRSILERNLGWLASQGARSVWINLHYQPEQIKQAIGTGERLGLNVRYSHEPTILGTAGAYKNLENKLRRTTLLVYGDSLVCFDLDKMLRSHTRTRAIATIALFDQNRHPHTGIAGGRVVVDADGKVTQFVETRGENGAASSLVNAGVYLLEPMVASLIPAGAFSDFGKEIFPTMLERSLDLRAHVIDDAGYCWGLTLRKISREGSN